MCSDGQLTQISKQAYHHMALAVLLLGKLFSDYYNRKQTTCDSLTTTKVVELS